MPQFSYLLMGNDHTNGTATAVWWYRWSYPGAGAVVERSASFDAQL